MLSQAMAMVVMVDMVPPLSLSPRPITDMATHSLTAMVTTPMVMERETLRLREDMDMEDTDMEVMVDTVMERDLLMLSPVMDMELVMVLPPPLTIHMEVPAPPTEAPRDFLDMAMVLTDMEREMLSPVMDTELVTVLPPPLTIHMEVPAPPTEAPRDFLDTDMVVT